MKINVKTAGLLGRYLPEHSGGNRVELEVAAGATPRDVIAQLGMPAEATYLVALNGEIVPAKERATRVLAEHDELSIMPPLRGG